MNFTVLAAFLLVRFRRRHRRQSDDGKTSKRDWKDRRRTLGPCNDLLKKLELEDGLECLKTHFRSQWRDGNEGGNWSSENEQQATSKQSKPAMFDFVQLVASDAKCDCGKNRTLQTCHSQLVNDLKKITDMQQWAQGHNTQDILHTTHDELKKTPLG